MTEWSPTERPRMLRSEVSPTSLRVGVHLATEIAHETR